MATSSTDQSGRRFNNFGPYRGYVGTCEYTPEDATYRGYVLGIRGFIEYHGAPSPEELEKEFQQSVDFYLEACDNCGETPEVPENVA